MPSIILASNSPRRKELLALSGLPFLILPVNIDESPLPDEDPQVCVRRLAETKAKTAASLVENMGFPANQLILASDTIVVMDQKILGKPIDEKQAEEMLVALRGKTHQVLTAISFSLAHSDEIVTDLCSTDVPMRVYTNDEIQAYIATGDPMDKAGAYAIQHPGFHPVSQMTGCYASVMGLPLCHLHRSLLKFGIRIEEDIAAACQAHLTYDCPVFQSILEEHGSE